MTYYNTTNKSGTPLDQSRDRAETQDALVMNCAIAIHHAGKQITPRRCWAVYQCNYNQVELTSVRRSINTLIKQSKLQYTGKKLEHKCPTKGFITTERTIKII